MTTVTAYLHYIGITITIFELMSLFIIGNAWIRTTIVCQRHDGRYIPIFVREEECDSFYGV